VKLQLLKEKEMPMCPRRDWLSKRSWEFTGKPEI